MHCGSRWAAGSAHTIGWTAGAGDPAPEISAPVIVGLGRQRYRKMPPDISAVFRRRLTTNPVPPLSERTDRTSDR